MNDIERAIKQFKEWEKDRWRLGKSPSIPTLILARQALEKQTPKEIIYDYGLNETRCPRCNTIFGYINKRRWTIIKMNHYKVEVTI
jgi:hypothetical protein